MNREILFKAKARENKGMPAEECWVEGYYAEMGTGENIKYYIIQNGALPKLFEKEEDNMCFVDVEVIPKTRCQYTGLADKNKKKIWEYDIVRRTDSHDSKEPSVGFIEYDAQNTSFLIHWTDVENYSATYPWKDKIEVIGNIFDNPKMLGGDYSD